MQAETNCRLFVDIRTGVEYLSEDDFSESFTRFELRLRWRIHEFNEVPDPDPANNNLPEGWDKNFKVFNPWRIQLNASGALTSVKSKDAMGVDEGAKALAARLGLQIDFLDFYERRDGKYFPNATVALLLEGGFNDPKSNVDNEVNADHFVGLRSYYRGESRFNGLSVDAGWGFSEQFDNQDRVKVRLYIPYRFYAKEEGSNFKIFGTVEVDVGGGKDELKLILGASLPIIQITNGLLAIIRGSKPKKDE